MNKTIFTKDPAQKKLVIERTFNAPLDLVWQAWTDSSILDQWWAPKPWQAETKSQDFSEGGHWLYSMNGPEGEQHWARADYLRIEFKQRFEANDSFCDDEGKINHDLPIMHWNIIFSEAGNDTNVIVHTTFDSVGDLDQITEMGFQEGFAAAHDNLDALLRQMV